MRRDRALMIMAAGTGGHIFPGLAIAQTMRARGWASAGSAPRTAWRATLVPKHGIAMDTSLRRHARQGPGDDAAAAGEPAARLLAEPRASLRS